MSAEGDLKKKIPDVVGGLKDINERDQRANPKV